VKLNIARCARVIMETFVMGLLDELPLGLLNLIQSDAQNHNSKASSGPGATRDPPFWLPRQPPRLPLSLAGPNFVTDTATSEPQAPSPRPRSTNAAQAIAYPWLPANQSADLPGAQPAAHAAQNLTAQALRMKGVPETDIAAATGNPELIKRLIMQNYGSGFSGTTAQTGLMSDGINIGGSPGDLYDDGTAPTRNRGPQNAEIAEPYSPNQDPNHSFQQAGVTSDKSVYCRTMRGICIRQCEGILGRPDAFGPFRACMRTCMHNAGCLDF
jgi:hypothetical protein